MLWALNLRTLDLVIQSNITALAIMEKGEGGIMYVKFYHVWQILLE